MGEFVHASDGGESFLESNQFKMRVKEWVEDPSYYEDIVEQRPRVKHAQEWLESQGIDYTKASDQEILDALLDRPIDSLPSDVQSLVETYVEEDIPKAIRGFLGTSLLVGIGAAGLNNQQFNSYKLGGQIKRRIKL